MQISSVNINNLREEKRPGFRTCFDNCQRFERYMKFCFTAFVFGIPMQSTPLSFKIKKLIEKKRELSLMNYFSTILLMFTLRLLVQGNFIFCSMKEHSKTEINVSDLLRKKMRK